MDEEVTDNEFSFITEDERIIANLDEAPLRQLLESCAKRDGQDHPTTIVIKHHLVVRLLKNTKYADAMPLAKHVMEFNERMGVDANPYRLSSSLSNMAMCMQKAGRNDEAERLSIQALNTAQSGLGQEHPITLCYCNNLAVLQTAMGKDAQGEAMYRRMVEFNTRLLGLEHPQTIKVLANLGSCLARQGKVEEAVPTLRKALDLSIRVHGLKHESTIRTMIHMGRTFMSDHVRDFNQAERMLRRAMELSTETMGLDDPCTLDSTLDLGRTLSRAGNMEAALPLVRLGLQLHQRAFGDEHPETLFAFQSLAEVLGDGMGRYTEAEAVARSALEVSTSLYGAEHASTKKAARVVERMRMKARQAHRQQRGRGGRR